MFQLGEVADYPNIDLSKLALKVSSTIARIALPIFAGIYLSACVAIVYHGCFIGADAAGWDYSRDGTSQIYTRPATDLGKTSLFTFVCGSSQKGTIWLNFIDPYRVRGAPSLEGRKVTIVFNDKNERREIDVAPGKSIDVGDSLDFSIIVPPFQLGTILVPRFEARFRWSERDVRYYQKLM